MQRFELTMTTNYVGHWKEWEAVREILQNAIDFGNPIIRQGFGKLEIISENVSLSPASLLLGYTTKDGDSSKIGQFGEGYKLSCLVLCRLGIDFKIWNGEKLWIPKLEHSERYGCEILVIEETDAGAYSSCDLTFEIKTNIDLKGKYLPNMTESKILNGQHGLIYVGGLYVCELKDFRHGYNFAPGDIELGRDRQMVSSYDVSWQIAALWNESGREQEVYEMLMNEVPDVSSLDSYRSNMIGKGVAASYVSRYGNLYPVTTQEDIEAVGGQGYQVVPKLLKVIVKRFHDFAIKMFGSPLSRLTSWKKRYGYTFSDEANKELASIIRQMGGLKDDDGEETT